MSPIHILPTVAFCQWASKMSGFWAVYVAGGGKVVFAGATGDWMWTGRRMQRAC